MSPRSRKPPRQNERPAASGRPGASAPGTPGQAPAGELHPAPGAAHLPAPTVWPCALAAGITLIALGLVTTLAFTVAGVVVFALALAGWLGELLRDQ
ncbi:MAG TPA: hypothetical protein VK066_01805 [Chloroflexota bacterium]|nr:hypothetical protein [Chloroflexota bacterium]